MEVLDGLAPWWQAGTWLHDSVSVLPRYESFYRGIVSLGDATYFAILSAACLAMNEVTLKLPPQRAAGITGRRLMSPGSS
ncbi:MAG: hypothetical protein JXA90_15415 [Planctomycetes bacterium]|nr:hypothetical protein [Planctomycetota bacterium]